MKNIYRTDYQPDYNNIVNAAWNRETETIPLYEHSICFEIMRDITGDDFINLFWGGFEDKKEFFRRCCEFYRLMGYDAISHECGITSIIMGGQALSGHVPGPIQDRDDFERYPWDELTDKYFKLFSDEFRALSAVLPAGMKAIGGVGNGVLEIAEDLVGYFPLCYMSEDDPELYADIFAKVGWLMESIWRRFLDEYGDAYCVFRIGDDLGFKSNTLISAADIRRHIIPQYKKIIDLVHGRGKPFLLHSCGCIFPVMEDLIAAGINAKHSNEDQIARFPEWVERYGDRIGNFGGIDTDVVCRMPENDMREYIAEVVKKSRGHGGFAFGSGNSIPNYVPVEQFIAMNRIIRTLRGE